MGFDLHWVMFAYPLYFISFRMESLHYVITDMMIQNWLGLTVAKQTTSCCFPSLRFMIRIHLPWAQDIGTEKLPFTSARWSWTQPLFTSLQNQFPSVKSIPSSSSSSSSSPIPILASSPSFSTQRRHHLIHLHAVNNSWPDLGLKTAAAPPLKGDKRIMKGFLTPPSPRVAHYASISFCLWQSTDLITLLSKRNPSLFHNTFPDHNNTTSVLSSLRAVLLSENVQWFW